MSTLKPLDRRKVLDYLQKMMLSNKPTHQGRIIETVRQSKYIMALNMTAEITYGTFEVDE